MEKIILIGQDTCNEALKTLFKAAYFIGKQFFPYFKFFALCKLLMFVNAPIITSMYQDEKACSDLITCISAIFKKIFCKIRNSPFFGIMIDESTYISVSGHFIMFATIVEEGLPKTDCLGLLQLNDGKNDSTSIFDCVIS